MNVLFCVQTVLMLFCIIISVLALQKNSNLALKNSKIEIQKPNHKISRALLFPMVRYTNIPNISTIS